MSAFHDPRWGCAFRQMLPAGLCLLLGGLACGVPEASERAQETGLDTSSVHPLEDVLFDSPAPLPTADTVVLSFHLPERARLEIAILDGSGQLILQPWQGILPAGTHRLPLDLSALEAGPWVCTLSGRLLATQRTFVRAQVVVRQ